jgi:hypothetical protein
MISFILLCNVLKSQGIDALYCVIIMNPMIQMYFVNKLGGKFLKIT